MAIIIRNVNGVVVALCAAETDPKVGDVYLDDAAHHALSTKFALDWQSEGLMENPPFDKEVAACMASQKVRDAEEELLKWLGEHTPEKGVQNGTDTLTPANAS